MGKLQDRVALVTGGGQGLGYDMARAFADAGAKVVLTGRVQEKLDAKAAMLRGQGAEVLVIAGDVRFRATAGDAVARTLDVFGRLDILVNNAQSLSLPVPLAEQDDEHMETIIRSGLFGTMYFMQAAYPSLKSQGGSIINLGSGQGVVGGEGTASYSAAKEGIRGLTRVAAREWGKDGIRVNVVCPGAMSESFENWYKDKPEELAALTAQVPLRRFADGYSDLGSLVTFLAGPECFLTGQTIFIDGGGLRG